MAWLKVLSVLMIDAFLHDAAPKASAAAKILVPRRRSRSECMTGRVCAGRRLLLDCSLAQVPWPSGDEFETDVFRQHYRCVLYAFALFQLRKGEDSR
jgi:hypothetical protein